MPSAPPSQAPDGTRPSRGPTASVSTAPATPRDAPVASTDNPAGSRGSTVRPSARAGPGSAQRTAQHTANAVPAAPTLARRVTGACRVTAPPQRRFVKMQLLWSRRRRTSTARAVRPSKPRRWPCARRTCCKTSSGCGRACSGAGVTKTFCEAGVCKPVCSGAWRARSAYECRTATRTSAIATGRPIVVEGTRSAHQMAPASAIRWGTTARTERPAPEIAVATAGRAAIRSNASSRRLGRSRKYRSCASPGSERRHWRNAERCGPGAPGEIPPERQLL